MAMKMLLLTLLGVTYALDTTMSVDARGGIAQSTLQLREGEKTVETKKQPADDAATDGAAAAEESVLPTSDPAAAEEVKEVYVEPEGPPAWRHMTMAIIVAVITTLIVAIIIIIAAAFLIFHMDRKGVDEGKELPTVSAEEGNAYLQENSVGFLQESNKWIPLMQNQAAFEKTLGQVGGTGIQAYFNMFRQAMLIMSLITVFMIPMISYCYIGGKDGQVEGALATMSAANIDHDAMHNAQGLATHWSRYFLVTTWAGGVLTAESLTLGLGVADAMTAMIFFAWTMYLIIYSLPKLAFDHDEGTITMSDFSVYIDGLPGKVRGDDYEAALKEHLVKVVTEARTEKNIESETPVEVKQLTLARDLCGDVGGFQKLHELKEASKVEKEKNRSGHARDIDLQIDTLRAKLLTGAVEDKTTLPVVRAYAVFARQGDVDLIVQKYSNVRYMFRNKCDDNLKFEGVGITVEVAPEPEDVNWATQDINTNTRYGYIAASIVLQILLFLLFALGMAKVINSKLANEEAATQCQNTEGQIDLVSVEDALEMDVTDGLLDDCVCAGVGFGKIYKTKDLWHRCARYMDGQMKLKFTGLLIVVCTIICCEVYELVCEFLAEFEKPLTFSGFEYNLFVSMFRLHVFAKLACVTVVTMQAFGGEYMVFSHAWYTHIGEILLIQLCVVAFALLFVRFLKAILLPWLVGKLFNKFSHQKMANEVGHLRFPFEVSKRSAECLMFFTGVMILYTAIPICLVVCILWCFAQLFMDRVYLIRACGRKNIHFNLVIANQMAWGFNILACLHCFCGAYMLGSPIMYPSVLMGWAKGYDLEDKAWTADDIQQLSRGQNLALHFGNRASAPLFAVGCTILLWYVVYLVAKIAGHDLIGMMSPYKGRVVTSDDEQVFTPEEIEKKGFVTSYNPEEHPEVGPIYKTMADVAKEPPSASPEPVQPPPAATQDPPPTDGVTL